MSPRLILLNGPPGSGKSTIAELYAAHHPLTLNLDIDRIRRFLGAWRADPVTARHAARNLALAMARAHLMAGHDVVVPQFLGRIEFIEQLEGLSTQTGADFVEITLMMGKDEALRQFARRTAAAADPVHLEAQEMVDAMGGQAALEVAHDKLVELLATRPRAHIVNVTTGHPEKLYDEVESLLR